MIIANPLYDTVFKRLMEDGEVANFVVSTLLGVPVISIEVKSQEITYVEEEQSKVQAVALRMYRLDFVATISTGKNAKTGKDEYAKVLIEVQKALKLTNLQRFRNYVSTQYKQDSIIDGKKTVLPIIAIYILGFQLPEILTACVRVNKNYFDAVEDKNLDDVKSHFIERVMHNCVVVQAGRIKKGRYSKALDKLLSVFEQDYFVDGEITKDYAYSIDDENIRRIINVLHFCASDVEERKKIEAEQEAWDTYRELLESAEIENLQTIEQERAEKERERAEKEQERAKKEAAFAVIAEKEAIIARERAEKERERAEKEALLAEIARLRQ